MKRHILIVDDDANVLACLRRLLRTVLRTPPTVVVTQEPLEALKLLCDNAFDVVISDYHMPGMDGVTFLDLVRTRQPEAARVILSGMADQAVLAKAINQAQILRFVAKPWCDADIAAALTAGFSHHDRLMEERSLVDESLRRVGAITPRELERRRLEALAPGITRVNRGPDGSVIVDDAAAR